MIQKPLNTEIDKECVDANSTQVGGDHYKSKMQHWDWVWYNNLDYFQAQITKYVARHKKKGGIEDLKKAQHFLGKYIELLEKDSPLTPKDTANTEKQKGRIWSGFSLFSSIPHQLIYTCNYCGAAINVPLGVDPFQEHGHCPTRDYVNQEAAKQGQEQALRQPWPK